MAIEVIIPRRLRRSRARGWRRPSGSVIVDRTSRWGNPWAVVYDRGGFWGVSRPDRAGNPVPVERWYLDRSQAVEAAVARFRRYLTMVPAGRDLAARSAEELSGKNLVCWCPLDGPCHADILLRVARGDSP